jgi:hypothetical protein
MSGIEIAEGVRHWDRSQMSARHFWGLPYAMAGVELATGLSGAAALWLICLLSSGLTLGLATRLWGGWVAAWFAVINWDWIVGRSRRNISRRTQTAQRAGSAGGRAGDHRAAGGRLGFGGAGVGLDRAAQLPQGHSSGRDRDLRGGG